MRWRRSKRFVPAPVPPSLQSSSQLHPARSLPTMETVRGFGQIAITGGFRRLSLTRAHCVVVQRHPGRRNRCRGECRSNALGCSGTQLGLASPRCRPVGKQPRRSPLAAECQPAARLVPRRAAKRARRLFPRRRQADRETSPPRWSTRRILQAMDERKPLPWSTHLLDEQNRLRRRNRSHLATRGRPQFPPAESPLTARPYQP